MTYRRSGRRPRTNDEPAALSQGGESQPLADRRPGHRCLYVEVTNTATSCARPAAHFVDLARRRTSTGIGLVR